MVDINPELYKKDNETELEHHKRIIYGKLVDKTLSDEDYSDLSEVAYGQRLSSDVARREFYGSKQTLDIINKESENKISEDGYFKELAIKKQELEKERQKLNATKVEYNRDIRQQARFELFYENIKNSLDTLPLPDFYPIISELDSQKEYCLTIADIHAGAKFKSENNEYSLDICKERFQVLLGETIKFVQEKGISKIKIVELGDSIQGLLRVSDLKLNETSIVEATIFISRTISQFLNELSSYCMVDYYHVPSSNHSQIRPLGTKASEIASEDVEFVISNYIKDVLCNNNRVSVNLNFGKEYIKVPILDFECIAMHGHQIRDIKNSLKNLSHLHRTFYDFTFLAHFHGGSEIIVGESIVGDTEVLICPSFIGSDPYSDFIMRGSKSSCKIWGFDYYNGHTETYKIVLN